jgi:hypothetical protein
MFTVLVALRKTDRRFTNGNDIEYLDIHLPPMQPALVRGEGMLVLPLMIAFAQIYGTDFPDTFRQGKVGGYLTCIRVEGTKDADPQQEPASGMPTIAYYGQLTRYCDSRRSKAIPELLKLIEARHPDWPRKRLDEAVEYVLSGLELEIINNARRPTDMSVHDFLPPPRF